MKYIFFDIECANSFNSVYKICEFGYVITDENFNVISKDDIPMSPGDKRYKQNRFDEGIYDRDPKFGWAYDFEYYYSQPLFPHFYNKLKELLEGEDTIAFGFAIENDLGFLASECNRYKLEQFNFKVCDIRFIANKHGMRGLETTFKRLCKPGEFINIQPHLSRDDAYMTMRVLQELLKKEEKTLNEYIESKISHKENSVEYFAKRKERKEFRKEHPELFAGPKGKKSAMQKTWGDFYRQHLEEVSKEESKGRIVTISKTIKYDPTVLDNVINEIKNHNFIPSDHVTGSDFFITSDEADAVRLKETLKYPFEGQFITYKDFTGFDLPENYGDPFKKIK